MHVFKSFNIGVMSIEIVFVCRCARTARVLLIESGDEVRGGCVIRRVARLRVVRVAILLRTRRLVLCLRQLLPIHRGQRGEELGARLALRSVRRFTSVRRR